MATREHVRRVAVTAFGAIEHQEPIEGFHGLSRPVLDDPLAGVRAGRLVADVAAGALREWALRARGAGRSWDAVGAGPRAACRARQERPAAEAAWEWLVEHRPPRSGARARSTWRQRCGRARPAGRGCGTPARSPRTPTTARPATSTTAPAARRPSRRGAHDEEGDADA